MFTKYELGAEVDITEAYKYELGAEVEAEAVYAYKDGAEEAVWTSHPTCQWYGVTKNSDTTTYSYEVSNDGKTLSYSITNDTATSSSSALSFRINKAGGFGNVIKIKYTITQTIQNACATTGFASSSMTYLSSEKAFRNYFSCNNETFEGTVTLDTDQEWLYIFIDAYSNYDITATITDLYINDEPVTFIE